MRVRPTPLIGPPSVWVVSVADTHAGAYNRDRFHDGGVRWRRGTIRALIETRRRTPQLSAAAPLRILDGLDARVFGFVREHPLGWLTALHGFADVDVVVDPACLPRPPGGILLDLLDGSRRLATQPIVVPARGVLWLVAADGVG